MKKTLNRLLAIIAAITMVFAFGVTAFAAVPSSEDKGSITVKGITTEGVTVTAYQIVGAAYSDGGLTGWTDLTTNKVLTKDGVVTVNSETLSQVNTDGMTGIRLSYDESSGDYYKDGLGAGSYLIKVTNSGTDIYNDMVVSLGYDENGNLVAGTVTAEGDTSDATAYAKKTEETVKKEYDKTTDKSVEVGDSVPFTITTTLPSYDNSVETAIFKVTDTASDGLTLPAAGDITVKVNGTAVTSDQATVAVDGQTFTVTFASDYIKSLANKTATERAVVITYNATINANASKENSNIGEYTNATTIEYTNESGETTKTTDKTHEYTFNYNGDGNVAKKVDSAGNALAGAEFTIYTDEACRKKLETAATTGVCTTDENGKFYFNGLDEDKVYYIKETKAPAGYSLLTGTMTVKIDPTYSNNAGCTDTLLSYTVTTTDFNGATKTVTYKPNENGTDAAVTSTYQETDRTDIKNTTISQLPSTGGIGTYLFTIIGVAVMVVGAASIILIIRNKKKAEQ